MATFNGTNAAENYTGPWGESNIILGNGGKDTLTGGSLSDSIDGGNGNDTVNGSFGHDLLFGGTDNDSILGGQGDDEIYDGQGNDTMDGGQGDDLVDLAGADTLDINTVKLGTGDDVAVGGKGTDVIDGGIGADIVSYASANAAVEVNLYQNRGTLGWAKDDTYVLIEHVIGSEYSDKLYGDIGANILDGLSGGDQLRGRGGQDTISGGFGQDTVIGGPGADLMDGGAGIDTLSYVGSNGANIDFLAETFAQGDAEGDSAVNFEVIQGSDVGQNTFFGDSADVTFIGGSQQDQLYGRAGDDTLQGGGSGDYMVGGEGNDTYTAGNAASPSAQDTFTWDGVYGDEGSGATDVVTDFEDGFDRINVQGMTFTSDISNWTETAIDWGGPQDPDVAVDDLQIVTDFGVTIILLNMTAAQFDINDTSGVVA